jgi:hypothetical protein
MGSIIFIGAGPRMGVPVAPRFAGEGRLAVGLVAPVDRCARGRRGEPSRARRPRPSAVADPAESRACARGSTGWLVAAPECGAVKMSAGDRIADH